MLEVVYENCSVHELGLWQGYLRWQPTESSISAHGLTE